MRPLSRIPLNALRAIDAVLRAGTLAKAAADLGVTAGAVSQQIPKAEGILGIALFDRTAAGLAPTATGEAMRPFLAAGFRSLNEAVAAASDGNERVLTITSAPAFTSRWLIPRLGRFAQRHPSIEIRFVATAELLDLSRGGIDLAIRLGRGDWSGLSAEKLMDQAMFPICTPRLARNL